MNSIFNPYTLNIFTDASVKKVNYETISCSGAVVEYNTQILETDYMVNRYSTNNDGEIKAIYLGVLKAIKYRSLIPELTRINLYSDSLICVRALREWIWGWVNNINGIRMYNSSGDMVKNQDMIMEVIRLIVSNNLSLNILHIKGHVNEKNMKSNDKHSIVYARDCYKKINGLDISIDTITSLCRYNNIVDKITRPPLDAINYNDKKCEYPFMYDPRGLNLDTYESLINKNRRLV